MVHLHTPLLGAIQHAIRVQQFFLTTKKPPKYLFYNGWMQSERVEDFVTDVC